MSVSTRLPETIDEYIRQQPTEVQHLLTALRATIAQAAPGATEKISYRMPTFCHRGNLVHFAAFKNHIGFYPTPGAITAFRKELAEFKSSRGAVQFPLTAKLPLKIVAKMVKYRVAENERRAGARTA